MEAIVDGREFDGTYGFNPDTVRFSDYSDYLAKGDNLAREDEAWLRDHQEARQDFAAIVNRMMREYDLRSIIEFGCGTGWLGQAVPLGALYTGVDANPGCVQLARQRNIRIGSSYTQGDIRTFVPSVKPDLVCSFAFLKHFGLHEWKDIFSKFLWHGRYAIFTLQTTDGEDLEDGTDYHHVWIGPETLRECLKNYEILHTEDRWKDPKSEKRDVLMIVRRRSAK